MPELPEVEIVRQSLNKKIKQKVVKKVLIRNRNLRSKIPLRLVGSEMCIRDRIIAIINLIKNILDKPFFIL